VNRWARFASIVSAATAAGCGASSPEPMAPLPPLPAAAHGTSFAPVVATSDDGTPAPSIAWHYRVNRGQTLSIDDPDVPTSATYDAEIVTIMNGVRDTELHSRLRAVNGAHGEMTISSVDTLAGNSGAVSMSTVNVSDNLDRPDGSQASRDGTKTYVWTQPMPGPPAQRDDFDQLASGFTATVGPVTAQVTGSVTQTIAGSMTVDPPYAATYTDTYTWTVIARLATFEVLGRTYADVVQVQSHGTATENGLSQAEGDTSWLAKGIGLIRFERAAPAFNDPRTLELIETNLVAP
jgi:hypothetical protein